MKMKFRYRYDWLQEILIKHLKEETEAKFRIRADRTIEFAKKWYPTVYEDHDVETVVDIERGLGLGLVDILNRKY